MFVLGRNAGNIWCALGRRFHLCAPDDRADDLEQLMREVFKVKICERIDTGFLTSVEFLHRKVGWNAEGFSWTHDSKHTLAIADGFGFNGKKQLEQTKWKVTVAPGSKTVGLDEQETQQYRSLVGTALYIGQDRPEIQCATKEAARFMSGPTHAAKSSLSDATSGNARRSPTSSTAPRRQQQLRQNCEQTWSPQRISQTFSSN